MAICSYIHCSVGKQAFVLPQPHCLILSGLIHPLTITQKQLKDLGFLLPGASQFV